ESGGKGWKGGRGKGGKRQGVKVGADLFNKFGTKAGDELRILSEFEHDCVDESLHQGNAAEQDRLDPAMAQPVGNRGARVAGVSEHEAHGQIAAHLLEHSGGKTCIE